METVAGRSVRTLEGVAAGGELDEVQSAFVDCFATQCGFCTAGMIMVAEALLDRNPDPEREDVVEAISGNVCRCTGYRPIVIAILDAAGSAVARRRETYRRRRRRMTYRLARSTRALRRRARRDDFTVIGSVVQRSDARGHVTGRTEFFEDVPRPACCT